MKMLVQSMFYTQDVREKLSMILKKHDCSIYDNLDKIMFCLENV